MTPRRTCVGCGTVRPQGELIRITLDAKGRLVPGRSAQGRGCWLCGTSAVECARAAARRRRWSRALRRPVEDVAAAQLLERLAPLQPESPP